MNVRKFFIVFAVVLTMIGVDAGCRQRKGLTSQLADRKINSVADIADLFPKSAAEIREYTDSAIEDARQRLRSIINMARTTRTFENSAQALDRLESLSNVAMMSRLNSILEKTHPDKDIRDAAHDMNLKISAFWAEEVANSRPLYQGFKGYVTLGAKTEKLDDEQRYYLQESMKGFKRAGLDLPDDKLKRLTELRKELAEIGSNFSRNIATDNRTITVDESGLKGLPEPFVAALKKNDDGTYILGVDYPTYFTVMDECAVGETRKRLFLAFNNRGYPDNDALLGQLTQKRDELAKLLGYTSYADYDLEEEMVGSPKRAREFLDGLFTKSKKKAAQEVKRFQADLPESVQLTKDGKFDPWDFSYVVSQYKKKHFDLDEEKVAEYFPMERTIEGLLNVYRRFFSIDFQEMPAEGFWHDEVRVLRVTEGPQKKVLGHILLDLFPRDNKYQHACCTQILPPLKLSEGRSTGIALVIANFPRETKARPSLLKRSEVQTFFHEFGHALHSLFGATKMGEFAGYNAKIDFVELPSQILEEWLYDPEILRMVSGHYETGEPLPTDTINTIINLKRLSSGLFVMRQCFLSYLALDYFKDGGAARPGELYAQLYKKLRLFSQMHPEDHMYAAFGHLTGYGAKYYGYLWSKVFALDLFEQIKKKGLLNPHIGRLYAKHILMPGGSIDPNILLERFLGRAPNQDAFLRDMGLDGKA